MRPVMAVVKEVVVKSSTIAAECWRRRRGH